MIEALKDYGIGQKKVITDPKVLKDKLDLIAEEEIRTYLHHEIGEDADEDFPSGIWKSIVSKFPHTGVERFARTLKDILADTNDKGMLKYIIKNEKKGSLGFYVGLLDGFRKLIFEDITSAYWDFKKFNDWKLIEEARKRGYEKAKGYALKLIEIYENGKTKGRKWTDRKINKELINPLGI